QVNTLPVRASRDDEKSRDQIREICRGLYLQVSRPEISLKGGPGRDGPSEDDDREPRDPSKTRRASPAASRTQGRGTCIAQSPRHGSVDGLSPARRAVLRHLP